MADRLILLRIYCKWKCLIKSMPGFIFLWGMRQFIDVLCILYNFNVFYSNWEKLHEKSDIITQAYTIKLLLVCSRNEYIKEIEVYRTFRKQVIMFKLHNPVVCDSNPIKKSFIKLISKFVYVNYYLIGVIHSRIITIGDCLQSHTTFFRQVVAKKRAVKNPKRVIPHITLKYALWTSELKLFRKKMIKLK